MNALWRGSPAHRPMGVADLDAVLAIEGASYRFPWTRGNFVDSLAAGYRCTLRLAAEGGLAGYAVAMPAVDEMHLLNLTVSPELQGRGHARALLQDLVAHCRERGQTSLWLEVRPSNQRARELYTRLGFLEAGLRRAYYPAPSGRREDALVMSLPIPAEGLCHGLD
jgi:ribosomal-protein-alanine N-acetyltransferase